MIHIHIVWMILILVGAFLVGVVYGYEDGAQFGEKSQIKRNREFEKELVRQNCVYRRELTNSGRVICKLHRKIARLKTLVPRPVKPN